MKKKIEVPESSEKVQKKNNGEISIVEEKVGNPLEVRLRIADNKNKIDDLAKIAGELKALSEDAKREIQSLKEKMSFNAKKSKQEIGLLKKQCKTLRKTDKKSRISSGVAVLFVVSIVVSVVLVVWNSIDHGSAGEEISVIKDYFTEFPLGMESGLIKDEQLTASSSWSDKHLPKQARLNRIYGHSGVGCWSPTMAKGGDPNGEYITVDLKGVFDISSISLQGRPVPNEAKFNQYVREFKLLYSVDGKHFKTFGILEGNTDRYSVVKRSFTVPFEARYVRIEPTKCNTFCATRFEVYALLNEKYMKNIEKDELCSMYHSCQKGEGTIYVPTP